MFRLLLFIHQNKRQLWLSILPDTPVPLNWQYKDARKLFFETPEVDDPVLAWSEPDEEGLVQFLCKERPLKYISVF